MAQINLPELNGYQLDKVIGSGGFGTVYKAQQLSVGREVAIKVIRPEVANNPEYIRRFEAEAQLIARLEHPHITPLIDYWRDPKGAYLVMRYLNGGSLKDILKQEGAMGLNTIATVLDQIASALDFAHRQQVIHRDIKPGNLLLDEDGNAYLADFGIAKNLTIENPETSPDAVVGSLDYISPEQARSEPVTGRTDIYSLGVTLYELVAGEHPFKESTRIERLYKHINDPLPDLPLRDDIDASVLSALNDVIDKATAKDPQNRYPDVRTLALSYSEAIGEDETEQGISIAESLTMREHEVLQLLAQGFSNKEMAEHLFITESGVRWHLKNIYKKLQTRDRVQAIIRAGELNLITTERIADIVEDTSSTPSASNISLPEPENPYKGLHAFQTHDRRDFFGREDISEKLIQRLAEEDPFHRFLAIVGPSGSGKSSLVRAGVIPSIWQGNLPNSEKWFIVDMLPGEHPLDELEVALTRVAANQATHLNEHLQRDARGLVRAAELILPKDDTQLVIVIDQFEEVFTLLTDETARQHFLDLIYTAVTDARSRVYVMVTLRADYYDRPLYYPEFGEMLRSRMDTILPLSAKGLERAIRGPAERVGVTFEQGLVAQMVSEMNYQAGALPLLQYALTELFDRREGRLLTHKAYNDIGGAVGALANRADEIYLNLTEEAQSLAQQMFMRLVTLGEGAEDTRRRANHSELLSLTNNTDMMDEIIDQFASYRLLALDHDPETRQPTVEVAHEAILREWERLRGWLNEGRDDIRMHLSLMYSAKEWEESFHEKSYLLSGIKLAQFENWLNTTDLVLDMKELAFLNVSIKNQSEERRIDTLRKSREEKTALRAKNFQKASAILTIVAIIAFVATIGASIASFNAIQAQQDSVAQQATVEQLALELRSELITSNAESANLRQDALNFAESVELALLAQSLYNEDEPFIALTLALEASYIHNPPQTERILSTLAYRPGAQNQFIGHSGFVNGLSYSPDGLQLASGAGNTRDEFIDSSLIWWNANTGEILRRSPGIRFMFTRIQFSPDGRDIIGGHSNGISAVTIWDANTGSGGILHQFFNDNTFFSSVSDANYTPDGSQILVATWEGIIYLLDAESGDIVRQFGNIESVIDSVSINPDGTLAVSGSRDGVMRLWNVQTGELLREHEQFSGRVIQVEFSPNGEFILSALADGSLILWNTGNGNMVRQFIGHTSDVTDIVFNSNGTQFVSVSADSTVILWNVRTGEILRRFEGHSGVIWSVAMSPDDTQVASGADDGELLVWDMLPGNIIDHFESYSHDIRALALSPDGSKLTVAGDDETMLLLDSATGEVLRRFEGHSDLINSVAFNANGTQILTGSDDNTLILWDVITGNILQQYEGHLESVRSVAFSPDSTQVVSGSFDDTLILWDTGTGEMINQFFGHEVGINSLAFSPDGSQLISGSSDDTVILWDVNTGEIINRFFGHGDRIQTVAFNSDGSQIISGSEDNTIILWDVDTGELVTQFQGHSDWVMSVTFSSDDTQIISGSADDSIIVWDIETGGILRHYEGHTGDVTSVVTSPDSNQILSGSLDSTIIIWRYDTLEQLQTWTQENRYLHTLTCEQRIAYGLSACGDETVASSP